MRIAIMTSGILPVPAVQGGAVENLLDFYLEYNHKYRQHNITVYSVWHPNVENHPALKSEVNHYEFIMVDGLWARLKKKIYQKTHRREYYNYHIEYFFEEAYKKLRKKNYDCIILENRPGYVYKLSKRGHKCIALHLHNDHLHQGTAHDSFIFNNLWKILTVSDYIKGRVQTIKEDQKVQTVHNGIDLQQFNIQTNKPTISKGELGFSSQDVILVYSGRINKDKGVSELIDAMLQLKDYPRIKLMIIGGTFFGNTNNENDFIRSLKDKAKSIESNIVFTGFIPYEKMSEYLRIADIAVIPSIWDEPFGLTVAEAQAMGKPIITTRRGGIPEVVSKENAILLETDEHFVDNLAAAILDLYQHPEKRQKMSAASFARSKMFDKETFARNFFAALEKL